MLYLSASRINTFLQCPQKYKFIYIERRPTKAWAHFAAGNLAHKALEIFHDEIKKGSIEGFQVLMKKGFIEARKSHEANAGEENVAKIKQILQNYIHWYAGLEEKPKVLALEKSFNFRIGRYGCRGFIDRIDEIDANSIKISDYKTTSDEKYLKDPLQLGIYHLAMANNDFRGKKIITAYILLKHNFKEITHEFSEKEVLEFQKRIIEIGDAIEKEVEFKAKPGPLCQKWCEFRPICSAMKW
jgi:CRISPR/Cas system-associated exonuclease Cas4 (RecB family)